MDLLHDEHIGLHSGCVPQVCNDYLVLFSFELPLCYVVSGPLTALSKCSIIVKN
jgi:hypothetical protein